MSRKRKILINDARPGLDKLRYEVAGELGISEKWDKLNVDEKTMIGRYMSQNLVKMGMEEIIKKYGR